MDLLLNHALEVLPAKTAFGLVEPTPGVIWVKTVKWAVIPPVLVEVGVTSMEATKENPQHGPILVLLEALVEAGEVTVDVTPWSLPGRASHEMRNEKANMGDDVVRAARTPP